MSGVIWNIGLLLGLLVVVTILLTYANPSYISKDIIIVTTSIVGGITLDYLQRPNEFRTIISGGPRGFARKKAPTTAMNASKRGKAFIEMIEYAQAGRASGDWDGLKMWTEAKAKFADDNTATWTGPILNEEYSAVRERILRELPEYDADGSMNEANHFIIQCLRIPFKNKFTERRLMQVAYNIGQFKADSAMYDQKYIDEFYALKLDKMETYFN